MGLSSLAGLAVKSPACVVALELHQKFDVIGKGARPEILEECCAEKKLTLISKRDLHADSSYPPLLFEYGFQD